VTIIRATFVSQQPQYQEVEDLAGIKFYGSHALAEGNQHIWIMKMLDFSSAVSPTSSAYHQHKTNKI